MRALVEEVSATLGAITLLLDAWYMKGYLIIDALTRDAIVIGQATLPCMSRHHRENQDGPASTATASRRRSSRRFQKRTRNCPIYGRTVRYHTAVCRARFLDGRLVRVVWVSMFVDGKW